MRSSRPRATFKHNTKGAGNDSAERQDSTDLASAKYVIIDLSLIFLWRFRLAADQALGSTPCVYETMKRKTLAETDCARATERGKEG